MMNENLIELVVRTISKDFSLHIELCHKGDVGYIEDLFFSENDVRRGGLDIYDHIEKLMGIGEDDSKIIIEKWVNKKINLIENKYDINKLWFRTKNYGKLMGGYSGFTYSGRSTIQI